MMFDYGRAKRLVVEQIKDKGRTVTLVLKTQGVYRPELNSIQGGRDDTVQVKALFKVGRTLQADGTIAQDKTKTVLIAAQDTHNPKINDVIIDGGQEYVIISVDTAQYGDTILYYDIKIKR